VGTNESCVRVRTFMCVYARLRVCMHVCVQVRACVCVHLERDGMNDDGQKTSNGGREGERQRDA